MARARRLLAGAACVAVLVAAAPAAAQSARFRDGFFAANGLRLHYVAWPDVPVAGRPTIILLHGIARHAHTFDHIAPQLADNFQVIALDMRGHGDSAWSPEGAYLVQDYVKDLEVLVDDLRLPKVSLLGNSTGGRVAQVYAGLHPDRVDRLIVEDVGPERPQSIADALGRRFEREKAGWANEDELVAELVRQNARTPEAMLRTYAHYGVKTRDDGRLIWKRDPNLVKGFIETELWDSVSRITSPTLYVIGGASRIVPPETQDKLKRTLPNVRIVVMPGLGHYPDEENTAGFMTIARDFLQPSLPPAGQARGRAERPKIARIEKVQGNLYWITEGTGAPGASNLAVLVSENGVILVDTKNPGWGAEIQRLVKTITDKPVATIVNTHTHRDHTGSNLEFGERVEFIVQENTRANLSKQVCEPIANCGFLSDDKIRFLPKKTFKDRMTLGSGANRTDLYNFGAAHTSGDAIVVFPEARAAHFADLFARKTLPNIMTSDGGTILGHLHTLEEALATIKNVDTVITGHATSLMSWRDFEEFVQMNREFVHAAQDGLKGGKKPDDVAADITNRLAQKYAGYTIDLSKAKENVALVYEEIYRSGRYIR